MQPSAEKTVIVWGQDDVLIRAVENVLNTECDWKVIRISNDLDEMSQAQLLEEVIPDVLIIHAGTFTGDLRLLIQFVQEYPKLKIITIGLENNQMEIYSKKTVFIKESSDLLTAIQNDTPPE